ncbi:MAG: T9SS type A sorting domain-containing protein [Chitinophagales bacterium]|nr:T9SS type A sorting domain-containing protein [Chitinophagales bacterium]
MKSLFSFRIFLSVLFFSLFATTSFAHYGPRGLTGGSIHVGIQFNGIVYLGTEDAGVFESTNNQLVGWRLRAVGLKSGYITALAHSGTELYTATADSGIFILNGLVGSDRYWNKINNGLTNLSILSLVAVDTNTILAGSNGDGLFKTTNKGQNWTAVNSALLNEKEITALTKGGNRFFALVADGGVFASDDNGDTWFDLNDASTLNISESEYFSYNASTDELLVSNDDGLFILASASTTNSPSYTTAGTGLPSGIHVHGVDNNGTDWFLASHSGVYTTAASAVNWVSANVGLPTNDIGAIVAVGDTLIVGTYKFGAFKSNAATISWSANNTGMTNIDVYSVAGNGDSLVVTATEYGVTISKAIGLNPVIRNNGLTDSLNVNDVETGGNLIFAATANAGVFVTADEGLNWAPQNNGLTLLNIKRIVTGNGRKYAIDAAGKVFQSDLASSIWVAANNGLPANTVATSLGFYANNLILGTYGNGVFVKHRDSTLWVAFNTGLTDLNVTGVTSSAGKIFAGTDGSGVFVTDANAAAWSATAPIAISHFNAVPLNPNHIQYMSAVKDYVVASFKGGVVASYDGGVSWVEAGNQFNLPSYTNINKISFVTSRIFVTTETNNAQSNGIAEFELVDTMLVINEQTIHAPVAGITSYHDITSNINWQISAADTWVMVNVDSGAFSQTVTIQVAANPGVTRSSTVTLTDGGSRISTVTITQDGTTGVANVAETIVQVFPNPFSNELTLKASVADNTDVVLSDVSGRVIHTEKMNSGAARINTSSIAEGIYVLSIIENGKTIATRKVAK